MFQLRNERGLEALVDLLALKRDEALRLWRSAKGEDLVRYQSEYNQAQNIIEAVTKPPFSAA